METFTWINYYKKLAFKLLKFKTNRKDLIDIIRNTYTDINFKMPTLEYNNEIDDIDPFTVFGLFNKSMTKENRFKILKGIDKYLNVETDFPKDFDGIPTLNPINATFYTFKNDKSRNENDINNLWDLFESGLNYTLNQSNDNKNMLIKCLDVCLRIKCTGISKITMGLFWIAPDFYPNADGRNKWFINESVYKNKFTGKVVFPSSVNFGESYLNFRECLSDVIYDSEAVFTDFVDFSYKAWKLSEEVNKEIENNIKAASLNEWYPLYYSTGITTEKWVEILNDETITRKEMLEIFSNFKKLNGQATCTELANKFGKPVNYYNSNCSNYAKNIAERFDIPKFYIDKKFRWWPILFVGKNTNGEPGSWIWKLRDELSSALDNVLGTEAVSFQEYNKIDFLSEVYMTEAEYEELSEMLKFKKNIVLQGPPGVGKTFAAKRLAYSLLGTKDDTKIKFVQFHQNYSYEDFVLGYRPNENGGFVLTEGIFYEFCQKAINDKENDYFFIIDEINRGNISKIFGELLMLLEKEYRGSSNKVKLSYGNYELYLPNNLYIIGMMNTADRSIAMIDYALRRRFAFFDMKPNFSKLKENELLIKLIEVLEKINDDIIKDESLKEGFCIGHSYLCNVNNKEELLNVVKYELITLIKEYWFDNNYKYEEYKQMLLGCIND